MSTLPPVLLSAAKKLRKLIGSRRCGPDGELLWNFPPVPKDKARKITVYVKRFMAEARAVRHLSDEIERRASFTRRKNERPATLTEEQCDGCFWLVAAEQKNAGDLPPEYGGKLACVMLGPIYEAVKDLIPWAKQHSGDGPLAVSPSGAVSSVGVTPIELAATSSGEDTKPKGTAGEAPSEPEFAFWPDGDGYYLKGLGEAGHVTGKGAKGLHDLYRLVQSPGVPVPMIELDAGPGVDRLPGDAQSRQPVGDGKTFADIKAKRSQLKADIESAESELERDELQTELDKLQAEAIKMKGINGKARDMNNPNAYLRSTIHKRLNRVYDKMRERMPELVKHFGLSCGASGGDCFIYSPSALNITWNTDAK